MNKEKEIEELVKILQCGDDFCVDVGGKDCKTCSPNRIERCTVWKQAKLLYNAGYDNIEQYQNEIERLETELAHREEDLIHADEKVFYREMAVKLDEDKIKEQAVKDFAERLKDELWKFDGSWQEYDGEELCETVENLITELYGADE